MATQKSVWALFVSVLSAIFAPLAQAGEFPDTLEYTSYCEYLSPDSFRSNSPAGNPNVRLGVYKGQFEYEGVKLGNETYIYESFGDQVHLYYAWGKQKRWNIESAGCGVLIGTIDENGVITTQRMGNGAHAVYTPSGNGYRISYIRNGFITPGKVELVFSPPEL